MAKLWEKDWQLKDIVEHFETKEDLALDQELALYDAYGTMAHAMMLNKIGLLSKQELESVRKCVLEIVGLIGAGKFLLKPGDEDIHTKIENFMSEKYGEVGKKVHTGRSRNDQVLTDIRLYTKARLLDIEGSALDLASAFCTFAEKYEYVPMPGYTHMQKAMPSSIGMWAAAYTEAILDDLQALDSAYALNDMSPLGSAAAYGIPLALDREYTAKILGFGKVQQNSLYCQNSRGKIEAFIISALNSLLYDINRFASDVMLFTTSEFGFLKVDKDLCSGSSIMPQKKNVDIAELLRSKLHLGIGSYVQVASLPSSLISGYNRDLQDAKKPLIYMLGMAMESAVVAGILVKGIRPEDKKMAEGLTPEVFAAHAALTMAAKGTAFRDAYKEVGKNPASHAMPATKETLMLSKHIGGTGNLGLGAYAARATAKKEALAKERAAFIAALDKLLKN